MLGPPSEVDGDRGSGSDKRAAVTPIKTATVMLDDSPPQPAPHGRALSGEIRTRSSPLPGESSFGDAAIR